MGRAHGLIKKHQKINQLVQQGKLDEAIRLLRPLCRKQARNPAAWLTLASLCGRAGDPEGVLQAGQRVLEIDPNHAVALSLMGSASAQLGRLEAARNYLCRARDRQPDDAGILNNYGNILYLLGDLEAAETALCEAVQHQPDHADAQHNLGNLYLARQEHESACRHYLQAAALNPERFETHLRLGDLLIGRIGNPELARHHYQQARRLQPDDLTAATGVANALRYQGHLDQALGVIRELRARHPQEESVQASEADLLERQGERQAAYVICRQLLDRGSRNPLAIEVLLRLCRDFDCCSETAEVAEATLAATGLSPADRERLHFGLAGLYDRTGEYADAFIQYQAGNEVFDIPFDPDGFRRRIDELIHAFAPERLPQLARAESDSGQAVFIVGMPRSGTSLTEQILASHSAVAGAGELNTLNDIAAELSDSHLYPQGIDRLETGTLNRAATRYLDTLCEGREDYRLVTDKMPHNFLNLGLIALLLPGARIIHCVRDPRDTCLSIYFQKFGWLHPYGTRLEWLGGYYREYARLMRHWQTALDLPILTVRYEDLVADQAGMTRQMLDFLGLEWEDACLDFHQSSRTVATASYDQVRQKIYHHSRARWRNYASQLAPLIEALGDSLDSES